MSDTVNDFYQRAVRHARLLRGDTVSDDATMNVPTFEEWWQKAFGHQVNYADNPIVRFPARDAWNAANAATAARDAELASLKEENERLKESHKSFGDWWKHFMGAAAYDDLHFNTAETAWRVCTNTHTEVIKMLDEALNRLGKHTETLVAELATLRQLAGELAGACNQARATLAATVTKLCLKGGSAAPNPEGLWETAEGLEPTITTLDAALARWNVAHPQPSVPVQPVSIAFEEVEVSGENEETLQKFLPPRPAHPPTTSGGETT